MSAAETSVKSSANQDNIIDAKPIRYINPFVTDASDDAGNFNDNWDQDVDELVSWTTTLNV